MPSQSCNVGAKSISFDVVDNFGWRISWKSYRVTLTDGEVVQLESVLNKGKHSTRKRKRAQALLHAYRGWSDRKIADAVGMRRHSIELLRRRFVEDGFETVLEGKPKRHRNPVLDGRAEACLVALACGEELERRKRRTIRLLRNRLVADLELDALSHETVRQTLQKRTYALALHPAGRKRRIRRPDGGRFGCLRTPGRREEVIGMHGRMSQAIGRRRARVNPAATGRA
ncbi:MAG: helix-turn-helix domain-containing protein [Planctomycetota bacterium]|nr:helix-turn-helix domain-containing protein [Planctomycetota bacterium]